MLQSHEVSWSSAFLPMPVSLVVRKPIVKELPLSVWTNGGQDPQFGSRRAKCHLLRSLVPYSPRQVSSLLPVSCWALLRQIVIFSLPDALAGYFFGLQSDSLWEVAHLPSEHSQEGSRTTIRLVHFLLRNFGWVRVSLKWVWTEFLPPSMRKAQE